MLDLSAEDMCTAMALCASPSVRALSGLGAGLIADPVSGVLGAVGEIVKGVAAGAATVPNIAAAFGQNKQVNAQNKLTEEALQAQEVIAAEQAHASAASSAAWAATAKAAAPWVGGALALGLLGYGASRILKGRRRR